MSYSPYPPQFGNGMSSPVYMYGSPPPPDMPMVYMVPPGFRETARSPLANGSLVPGPATGSSPLSGPAASAQPGQYGAYMYPQYYPYGGQPPGSAPVSHPMFAGPSGFPYGPQSGQPMPVNAAHPVAMTYSPAAYQNPGPHPSQGPATQ